MDTYRAVAALRSLTRRTEQGSAPPGDELAVLLAHIAGNEVAPGGPYTYDGEPDVGWNLLIHRFLRANGVSLTGLDAFLTAALSEGANESRVLDTRQLAEEASRFSAAAQVSAAMPVGTVPVPGIVQRVHDEIRSEVGRRVRCSGSPDLERSAALLIGRTLSCSADGQMALMPLYLRTALGDSGSVFSEAEIARLGFASACFWASSMTYDDFWDDDEEAQPMLLPAANFLARQFAEILTGYASGTPGYDAFFSSSMSALDGANAWEIARCRLRVDGGRVHIPASLPDYGGYEQKFLAASGHALAPVAMLTRLGHAVDSEEVALLLEYFRNYLIAMQMNDDAHDWREDLRRGQVSTAVAELLAAWKRVYPESGSVHVMDDSAALEQLFWFEVLKPFCQRILRHCADARSALQKLACIEDVAPLDRLIAKNEKAAREAISLHRQSSEFLKALSGKVMHRI